MSIFTEVPDGFDPVRAMGSGVVHLATTREWEELQQFSAVYRGLRSTVRTVCAVGIHNVVVMRDPRGQVTAHRICVRCKRLAGPERRPL